MLTEVQAIIKKEGGLELALRKAKQRMRQDKKVWNNDIKSYFKSLQAEKEHEEATQGSHLDVTEKILSQHQYPISITHYPELTPHSSVRNLIPIEQDDEKNKSKKNKTERKKRMIKVSYAFKG